MNNISFSVWSCFYFNLTFLTFPADKWTKSAHSFWPTADRCPFGWASHPVYMSYTIINTMLTWCHTVWAYYMSVTFLVSIIYTWCNQTPRSRNWRESSASCSMGSPQHCSTGRIMYELQSVFEWGRISTWKCFMCRSLTKSAHTLIHTFQHKLSLQCRNEFRKIVM